MDKRIVFVGGGSIGHVAPLLSVYAALKKKTAFAPLFIISARVQERDILSAQKLPFLALRAPKFPRAISLSWITFIVLFPYALIRSVICMMRFRPALVFSKGGFVSVPVCLAARILGIRIILHESDSVPGLANRLIGRIAAQILAGFPGTTAPSTVFTGNPIRSLIKAPVKNEGLLLTGFSGKRPILLVIGGSQGARALNEAIFSQFNTLIERMDVIHLTGPANTPPIPAHARYFWREYIDAELPALYRIASVVVTRAGAGALGEIAYFSKPAIVIPIIGLAGNHQVENAKRLVEHDAALLLPQSELSELAPTIAALLADPAKATRLGHNLHGLFPSDADEKIAVILLAALSN